MAENEKEEDHEASHQYGLEDRAEGAVGLPVYHYWFKHGGYVWLGLFLLGNLLQAASGVVNMWFLQYWPADVVDRVTANQTERPLEFCMPTERLGLVFLRFRPWNLFCD